MLGAEGGAAAEAVGSDLSWVLMLLLLLLLGHGLQLLRHDHVPAVVLLGAEEEGGGAGLGRARVQGAEDVGVVVEAHLVQFVGAGENRGLENGE